MTEEPKEFKFDKVSPEVEKELEDMVYQNCLRFALFSRKWNSEQRAKKKQEQQWKPQND